MGWLRQTTDSSIGGKLIVAVTGLAMVGFVLAHLSGNLLVFGGPQAVNTYAEGLRKLGALLWVARIGLVAMALLHIVFAIKLNLANRAARPQAYAVKVYRSASFASRSMLLTGLLLLAYILFHLAHFTFRVTSPEVAALGESDVYQMIVLSFQQPLMAGLYIAAMILLGLHLSHGISSLVQTLGFNHPKYRRLVSAVGPTLGVLLTLGFSSIPAAVLLGLLK